MWLFHYNSMHLCGCVARQPRADWLAGSLAGWLSGRPWHFPGQLQLCCGPREAPSASASPQGLGDFSLRVPQARSVSPGKHRGRSPPRTDAVNPVPITSAPAPRGATSGALVMLPEPVPEALSPGVRSTGSSRCLCYAPTACSVRGPPCTSVGTSLCRALCIKRLGQLPSSFPSNF